MESRATKKYFYAPITGTIVTAICCFTPVIVILLAAVGLSSLTPYLDYFLFPALFVSIGLSIAAYGHWKKATK